MEVATAPAKVNRVTYTGDLGYEIWVAPEYQRRLYAEHQGWRGELRHDELRHARAVVLRLEKNFGTWFREFRPIYGPFEAGLDRFVKLTKTDFIGREAAREGTGRTGRSCTRIVHRRGRRHRRDGRRADLGQGRRHRLRHDRAAARVRRAALRRRRQARPAAEDATLRDGDWRVVGWVTSGGYAHYVERSMAQGYVPAAIWPATRARHVRDRDPGHSPCGANQSASARRPEWCADARRHSVAGRVMMLRRIQPLSPEAHERLN